MFSTYVNNDNHSLWCYYLTLIPLAIRLKLGDSNDGYILLIIAVMQECNAIG